jgi:hypothetical protein
MANNLGITEVAVAALTNSAAAHNLYSTRPSQAGIGGSLVIRVTGHDDDTALEADNPDLMALFHSPQFGQPWEKQKHSLKKVRFHGGVDAAIAACPTDVTLALPNYDYTTF